MDFLKKILDWFKSFPENYWNKFSSSQKILFGGTAVAIIVALVLMISIAANPNYQLLVRGLGDSEAGEVLQQLDEQGIPYKTDNSGAIYVPGSYDPQALRMKFFTSGVLGTNTRGFEILDNQPLGSTSFDKNVRYQTALSGELERSIMSIDGIDYAKVIATVPKFTYYARGETSKPEASVMLTLSPGYSPKPENVKAIMLLVSGAVEGLEYTDVRVVDNHSRILSETVVSGDDMGYASSQMELKQKTEKYYTDKVKGNLEQVFGIGRVVVISDILLNWETIEKEAKTYTPVGRTGGIVTSQETEKEMSTTGSTGSPVGVDSNVPPTYESTETGSEKTYERERNTTNYNVNEAYEKILQNNQGEILAKNVSVMIDSTDLATGVTEDFVATFVANAINATTTDIEIAFIPFNRSEESQMKAEMDAIKARDRFTQLMIGVALLALSMLLMMYLLIGRMKMKKNRERILERRKQFERELKEIPSEDNLSEEERELVEMIEALYNAAEQRPEEVALVLKVWLNE